MLIEQFVLLYKQAYQKTLCINMDVNMTDYLDIKHMRSQQFILFLNHDSTEEDEKDEIKTL